MLDKARKEGRTLAPAAGATAATPYAPAPEESASAVAATPEPYVTREHQLTSPDFTQSTPVDTEEAADADLL
jgi:hypothetical protein